MTGGQASSSLRFIHDLFTISCVCVQNPHHLDRILANYSTCVCSVPSRKINTWIPIFRHRSFAMPAGALLMSNCFHNVELSKRACSGKRMLTRRNLYIHRIPGLSYSPISPIFYIPPMFPTTLSTAFFNRWDSFTTRSLSSSAHSARKVAISAT